MSGPPVPDPPAGPGGLIVVIRDDPLAAARDLARTLRAELAVGGPDTETAVERLFASCASMAHDATHPSGGVDLAGLRAAMRRAEAIRDRTRTRIATELCATLNTDLVIHPETLHQTADELLAVRVALAEARRGRLPGPRAWGRPARTAAWVALVLGGVALAVLGPLVVGVATAVTAALAGSVDLVGRRRVRARAVVELTAAELEAHRRWERLAGTGTDPGRVAEVVRRYDPNQSVVTDLLAHHPAVRAVERVAALRRDAWVRAWRREVGDLTEPRAVDGAVAGAELVVAAPYADLSDQRAQALHHRLLALPPTYPVVVVLGPELRTDTRPVLDLTDAPTAIDLIDDEVRSGSPF